MRRAFGVLGCALAIAAASLGAVGCGSSSPALQAGAPLRIGYLASLTGYCAAYARQYVAGARLATRTINAHGGVLGHRLELIVRDDRANPAAGVLRARALVEGPARVRYLAGTCSSAVARSVAEQVANPVHAIYVAGAGDPAIFAAGREGYAFGTIPTATVEARNAAAYVRERPRWRRIAAIAEDYSYGYEVTGAFARALRGSGVTISSVRLLPSGGTDYAPFIERLLAERPGAVYLAMIAQDAVTFVRQALALGLFAKTHVVAIMDYGTLAAMPKPPVGVEGYTVYPSAAIYRTPFARELESLGTSVANGGAAGDGFNQIEVIAQGIDKAGSTDPARVRDALGGASVQVVQGSLRIGRCEHTLAAPIAMGPVVGPTRAQPFAHLEPLVLADTTEYLEC